MEQTLAPAVPQESSVVAPLLEQAVAPVTPRATPRKRDRTSKAVVNEPAPPPMEQVSVPIVQQESSTTEPQQEQAAVPVTPRVTQSKRMPQRQPETARAGGDIGYESDGRSYDPDIDDPTSDNEEIDLDGSAMDVDPESSPQSRIHDMGRQDSNILTELLALDKRKSSKGTIRAYQTYINKWMVRVCCA